MSRKSYYLAKLELQMLSGKLYVSVSLLVSVGIFSAMILNGLAILIWTLLMYRRDGSDTMWFCSCGFLAILAAAAVSVCLCSLSHHSSSHAHVLSCTLCC